MIFSIRDSLAFLVVIIGAGFLSSCFAQETVGEDHHADSCRLCQGKKHFHDRNPWMEMEADFRYRIIREQSRKLDRSLYHDRFWQRYRARLGMKFFLDDNIDLNMRIVSEPRYYDRDDRQEQFIRDEVLLDRLNLTFKEVFDMPLTIVAGRQNLHYGTGWLVVEGTPSDGSRTFFFDAVRLIYDFEDSDTTADLVYINNHRDSAKYIKPINDYDQDMAEQDESGAILWLTHRPQEDTLYEGYLIYKHDEVSSPASSSAVEGETYTFGGALQETINDNWSCRVEIAPQFGHKNGKNLASFATNNQLKYKFNDRYNNYLFFDYEHLSGDSDPTGNYDKLWGRDNFWGNCYTGTIDSIDGRESDSSNLHRFAAGWGFDTGKNSTLQTVYNFLLADHNTENSGTNGLSSNGNVRGHLLTTQFKLKQNPHLDHRINIEFFIPGNFLIYSGTNCYNYCCSGSLLIIT